MDSQTKRIMLQDEEPEIFSSVLEYLYKGDYYPRLIHNKRRNSWELEPPMEDDGRGGVESTVYHQGIDGELLKDTVIYCAAERYGLEELKRVSLRKQGLRECPPVSRHEHALSRHPNTDGSQNPASSAAPFSRRHDTPTQTRPTRTRNCGHTISPSSSAAAAPSSAAAPCNSRCTTEVPSSFLISLSPCATTSTTSPLRSKPF